MVFFSHVFQEHNRIAAKHHYTCTVPLGNCSALLLRHYYLPVRAIDQGKTNVNEITDWLINYLVRLQLDCIACLLQFIYQGINSNRNLS